MKIIGINCSPRKGQTTQKSLEDCLQAVHDESGGVTTDIIELADLNVCGCLGCDSGWLDKHFQGTDVTDKAILK